MKTRRIKVLCTMLLSVVLLSGCGDKAVSDTTAEENAPITQPAESESTPETEAPQPEETDSDSDSETASAETSDSDEETEFELYNLYIDINNEMVDYFYQVLSSYFDYVDFQEEFVLLEEDYWCMSNVSTFYEDMDNAWELAQGKTEKSSLDEAYLELYPVMRELAETLDLAAEYTDMKSYIDDDYAKGEEYHAVIWTDYNTYEPLADAFINELSIVADSQKEEELEQLKNDGYEAYYALAKLINTAQEIQSAIYDQGLDDSQLLDLDIESLQPLYDQYVEEVQIFLDYMKDEEQMYEEGFPVQSGAYAMLETSIRDSKTSLTDLFERVRNQEPLDEFELDSVFAADGSISMFHETLSDLIDNYNDLLSY